MVSVIESNTLSDSGDTLHFYKPLFRMVIVIEVKKLNRYFWHTCIIAEKVLFEKTQLPSHLPTLAHR